MNAKSKLGIGVKGKQLMRLNKIIKAASKSMVKSNSARKIILSALKGARSAVKEAGGKRQIIIPRVVPVPSKVGGFLPFLVSIFAGFSAVGAVAGRAASIAKAMNEVSTAKKQLEEDRRHNIKMEEIALEEGHFLKPYKTGAGLIIGGNKKKTKKNLKVRLPRRALADLDLIKYAKMPNLQA